MSQSLRKPQVSGCGKEGLIPATSNLLRFTLSANRSEYRGWASIRRTKLYATYAPDPGIPGHLGSRVIQGARYEV